MHGYSSDLTRVLVCGEPSDRLRRIHQTVVLAQDAAIRKIRPGVRFQDVDRAARAEIENAGHGKQFGHALGHGIGLEVHEAPRLGPNQLGELRAGMVVTVEPGIYLPGWGGVRIEDDVLVTRDGCEVLSHLDRDLDANTCSGSCGSAKGPIENHVAESLMAGSDVQVTSDDVFDLDRIRQLIELMKQHDLAEIDLRHDKQQIRLARGSQWR